MCNCMKQLNIYDSTTLIYFVFLSWLSLLHIAGGALLIALQLTELQLVQVYCTSVIIQFTFIFTAFILVILKPK